jgi:hypothetical protein
MDDVAPAFYEEARFNSQPTGGVGGQALAPQRGHQLTPNQLRLLHLLSRYSQPAAGPGEREQWVRRTPLLVLVYECVTAGALQYDYAPCSVAIEGTRAFMNVSQEGLSDLDALLEAGLVSALRVPTRQHDVTTCYQVAHSGLALLSSGALDKASIAAVDNVVTWGGALLQVVWERGTQGGADPDLRFVLRNAVGAKDSTVMDCEDVSYVASPYMPACLRPPGAHRAAPLASNAHRVADAAQATHAVRVDLDSAVALSGLVVLVGEWVPMGPNALVELAAKLGTGERVRGGYFAAGATADDVTAPAVAPAEMAKVDVLEAASARFVNAQAELHFANSDPDVLQVETFGLHVRSDGVVLHGLRVEAIGSVVERNLSLDLLARLLTDVVKDSSSILDALTNAQCGELMHTVFLGHPGSRDKMVVYLAAAIAPKLPAAAYLDRGAYEDELRQVLGDMRGAYDLTPADVLLVGANGLLLAGPGVARFEAPLTHWLALAARDAFVRNVHSRLFILGDACKGARAVAARFEADPSAAEAVAGTVQDIQQDVIHLDQVLQALEDSLAAQEDWSPTASSGQEGRAAEPQVPPSAALESALRIGATRVELLARVGDMRKIVAALHGEADGLRSAVGGVHDARELQLGGEMAASCEEVVRSLASLERAGVQLDALAGLLAGLVAFAALDRVTGQWSVVNTAWAQAYIVQPLMAKPLVWFALSMLLWLLLGVGVAACVWGAHDARAALCEFCATVNAPIDLVALDAYITRQRVHAEAAEVSSTGTVVTRMTWVDGKGTEVVLTVDSTHGFLLDVRLRRRRRRAAPGSLRPEALKQRFFSELAASGVMSHGDVAQVLGDTVAVQSTLDAVTGRYSDPDAPGRGPPKSRGPAGSHVDLVLCLRLPGEAFHREIPFGMMTWHELRTEIATKLGVRPHQLGPVVRWPHNILVADDDDVARLEPGTVLECSLKRGATARSWPNSPAGGGTPPSAGASPYMWEPAASAYAGGNGHPTW